MAVLHELNKILNVLLETNAADFSGYHKSFLTRRIQKRISATESKDINTYIKYINENKSEVDILLDELMINVSWFFRDTFSYDYIAKFVLVDLITQKINENKPLRIWSAGCSTGEEAYSIAILIMEVLEKSKQPLDVSISATDIDQKAMDIALEGMYPSDKLANIKYGLLEKYFTPRHDRFQLNSDVMCMVDVSKYDLLQESTYFPPAGVYGGFDLILCRNVLIYYVAEYQNKMLTKFHRSLNKDGILLLGEAEKPSRELKQRFRPLTRLCKIFRKR